MDKCSREPDEIPKHVRYPPAEKAELSALDELMTILDGRRGH
jgi:hypothetical protein